MSTQQMIELQALAAKCSMRVGQLISNAVGEHIKSSRNVVPTDAAIGNALYYIEDDELVKVSREFVAGYLGS